MIHILLIDNYDSFTYNVSQALTSLQPDIKVDVIRNDQISLPEVQRRLQGPFQQHGQEVPPYNAIVISPGPGRPENAGITLELIQELGVSKGTPILGICLGHQAIGEVFGGQVIRAPEPVHGKPAQIYHLDKGIFAGLPKPFVATRYHSLIVDLDTLPDDLEMTAWTEDGLIMGLQHRKYPWIQGVQFHPESILTKISDQQMLFKNFFSPFQVREIVLSGWEF
jgi:anthranilate synthase component II